MNNKLKRQVDSYSCQYGVLEEKLMDLRRVIFDYKKYEKKMEVKVDGMEKQIKYYGEVISQK